jgi:hypothetical protein
LTSIRLVGDHVVWKDSGKKLYFCAYWQQLVLSVVRSCKASTWLGYRLVRPDLDMEPQDAMNHGIDLKSASKDCSSMPELTDQEYRSLNDQSTALLSLQGS